MDDKKIKLYDTTLRDGSQGRMVQFSSIDKIRIAKALDDFGIDYIEGGWPGSNPKDMEFFKMAQNEEFQHAKIAAFGSTRRPNITPEEDTNLNALIEANTPVVTIFGKSWDLHVTDALKTSLEENLSMIESSIKFLKSKGKEVIYDAEHFFDGYKNNPGYAIKTLEATLSGGVDTIVLADTNGGTLPWELLKIIEEVKGALGIETLGIHAHNDSDMAVVNSLIGVGKGIVHIQGTINGYGERTGNANLCSIIPNLIIKMGYDAYCKENLHKLTELSKFVSELANLPHNPYLPFVGENAFSHKGGIHVSAVMKNPTTYEHINPELVGNRRNILVSELSGKSNILYKAKEMNINLPENDVVIREIVNKIKELENKGYQFEAASGSFELLIRKLLGKYPEFFKVLGYRVIVEKLGEDSELISEATVKFKIDDNIILTVAEGNGPVNALDKALRKGLVSFYPALKFIELVDYKVRVLQTDHGTGSRVRVLIENRGINRSWGTIGVSENIIEASFDALKDSIIYGLLKGV